MISAIIFDTIAGKGEGMKKETPQIHPSGEETHLLREILWTQQALMTVFSRLVGIPASRLVILRLLAVSESGEMGILAMARRLGIDAAAVTRQIQEMEQQGLVKRRLDPRDRRRSHVSLSAKGKRTFLQLHQRAHDLENTLIEGLPNQDVQTAAHTLARIRTAIEKLR